MGYLLLNVNDAIDNGRRVDGLRIDNLFFATVDLPA